jgi:hypothetical protein
MHSASSTNVVSGRYRATTSPPESADWPSACTRRSSPSAIRRSVCFVRCSNSPKKRWIVPPNHSCASAASAEQRNRPSIEAELLCSLGYHAGLLSLGAMREATEDEMIAHCRAVAEIIPVIGFYLQPSVGGRVLPYSFWRRFAEIDNVVAIKIAPFNRYQTLDVVRAVIEAGRDDITLYTGNDDSIVADFLTPFRFAARNAASSAVARPLVRLDAACGRTARTLPQCRRHTRVAAPRRRSHRQQRGLLRCRERLPRLHRRPA